MDLQRLAAALQRSWKLLAAASLAAFLAAITVAALQPAKYESRALVDVARLLNDENGFSNSERADRTVANELIVASDPALAGDVVRQLGGTEIEAVRRSVSIEQLPGTDTIEFTATTEDPALSAETATAYASGYVEARLARQTDALNDDADEIARELAVLREQFAALPEATTAQARTARAEALMEQYVALVSRELELRGTARSNPEAARLVAPALVPESPVGPPALVWGVVAALMTAVLGGLVVALLGRARDPVENRSDVEEFGLSVLAEVEPASRFRRSPPTVGRALETAAVNLTARRPIPQVIAILSVDVRDDTNVVAALVGQLRQQEERELVDSRSAGGGDGKSRPELALTSQIAIVGDLADAGGAADMRTVSQADLVLLVVHRGRTRRANLVRVLDQIEQVTSAPRAALLVHTRAAGTGGGRNATPVIRGRERLRARRSIRPGPSGLAWSGVPSAATRVDPASGSGLPGPS